MTKIMEEASISYIIMLVIIVIMFFSIFIAGIAILNFNNYYSMEKACNLSGGVVSNNLCRIGNEFYKVYPKDNSFFPEHILNKYPVGIKNE